MNTASLELCKELYKLSGWAGVNDLPTTHDMQLEYFPESFYPGSGGTPQYTLSYLLRKLPKSMTEFWGRAYPASPCLVYSGSQWVALYKSEMTGEHNDDELFNEFANTPEDAVCMLAIELFKQKVLKA